MVGGVFRYQQMCTGICHTMQGLALLASILAACLVLTAAQNYDDWIKSVDQLGQSITFACSDSNHPQDQNFVTNMTAESWMLPNFKLLNPGEVKDSVAVSPDGLSITIGNISVADFGIYHCLLRHNSNTLRMVKWGLNMKGPYFDNLWTKYQLNVIIACSTCFGFLALVALTVMTYYFRWRPPVESKEHEAFGQSEGSEYMLQTAIESRSSSESNEIIPVPKSSVVVAPSPISDVAPSPVPFVVHVPPPVFLLEPSAYDNTANTNDVGQTASTTAF